MEGPKVTEEIRRSDGDPTRSKIREYHLELSLDLVSWRAIPECARERGRLSLDDSAGLVTCKSRLGVAVRGRREWMT